ncbi:MAG: methyltransferase [Vicinamibacteria bacterium]|nr:methyltransferase [Vicinamibacteria bacterium]
MALERLKRAVARSAPLTRLLFGIRVPSDTAQGHWDYSTLVLFDELRRRAKPGHRVLEMGTGETGTLSVALARRVSGAYLALDIAEDAVLSARRVAAENEASVEFLQSDLFAAVPADRAFDITFFNPPYVPRARSIRWRTLGEPARVWDGGEDGLDVIRKFWRAAEPRGAGLGEILMGFNRKSVPEGEVAALARASGFDVTGVRRAFHPGTVFAFRKA